MPVPPPPPPPPVPSATVPDDANRSLVEQLRESRAARKAAADKLMCEAKHAIDETTPASGYDLEEIRARVDEEDDEDTDDVEGSGVHLIPDPTRRLTLRRERVDEARDERRRCAARLKRTAYGVNTYADTQEFRLPEAEEA